MKTFLSPRHFNFKAYIDSIDTKWEIYSVLCPISFFWLSMTLSQQIFRLPLFCLIPGNSIFSVPTGVLVLILNVMICDDLYMRMTRRIFERDVKALKPSPFTIERDRMRNLAVGLISFLVVFRADLFRAGLPSSIVELGVFSRGHLGGYMLATGEKTTVVQRKKIQELGKIFGCHHCGSFQIRSGANFIADHIPPTGLVEAMERNPIRQFLKLKVTQKLWPQCQDCFRFQAAAVKRCKKGLGLLDSRPLVFHYSPRIYHSTYLLMRFARDHIPPIAMASIKTNVASSLRTISRHLLPPSKGILMLTKEPEHDPISDSLGNNFICCGEVGSSTTENIA